MKANYILFIIVLSFFIQTVCNTCSSGSKIEEGSSCFNEIIIIGDGYRAGQFTTRSDGVLFIEYSSGSSRLFYSLQPNGRGNFENDNSIYILSDIKKAYRKDKDNNDNNIEVKERYESKNTLVQIENDSSKEYIFSVSSYYSLTELHYFDSNNNNNHKTWLTTDFFDINGQQYYIFSYQFSLMRGFKEFSQTYYAAYIQYKSTNTNNEDYSDSYTLSKFKFTSLDSHEVTNKEFFNNYDNRIVSAIMIERYDSIFIFFLKTNPATYYLRTHSLDDLSQKSEVSLYKIADDQGNDNANPGEGIFFKALYLRFEYVAFIFFTGKNQGTSLILIIYFFESIYSYKERIKKYINNYNLDTNITMNDFYKINEEKLLFVSNIGKTELIIMFFDTCDWYNYINTRVYKFDMGGYYFNKELSIDFFNEILMLTSTVSPNGQSSLSSLLIFFSYPNGTDFYMNISPYLTDSEYYVEGNNLIKYLLENVYSIDNNIFGYSRIEKVKLISIPNEIIFYKNGNKLTNNEEVDSSVILKQDQDLIKYDTNYTLDYQFMALGLVTYDNVYNHAHDKYSQANNGYNGNSLKNNYTQKTYYGRVNRLTFKLCHDYCETCKELGNSNDNQKCITFLSKYKYDYFNFFNIYPENCVPEGYFNDLTNKKLIGCNSTNSKYYYNITDNNKRICFDKEKECPDTYSFLNTTTNECLNYTPPVTTIPIILTTLPLIPTTIPKIPTTIPKIPTTIPKIPTTIPKKEKIPTTIIEKEQTTIINKIATTITEKERTTIIPTKPSTVIINSPTTDITKIPSTIMNNKETELKTNINIPPTTNIVNIETTTIDNPQSTFITTIPIIKTTIPEIVHTTLPMNIPTTIPKINPSTTTPKKIITTIPTTIPKKTEIIPSTIYQDKCLSGTYITNLCSNITDDELFTRLKDEIFQSYNSDKSAKVYSGNGDYALRVSNTKNEIDFSNGLSIVDLGECETLLKVENNIPFEAELIILKKEKKDSPADEKDVQYDIYNPLTYEILNLSICENTTIDLYVPVKLSDEQEKYYNNLLDQGYNVFNLNDKFYREICTPYSSENGTDVLLDEREEFVYSSIAEQMVCQNNCYYSSYSLDTKYMKCECGNNVNVVTLDIKHLSKENILQSFLSTFKSTNYKVMICYNLVFNFKIFIKNVGSIVTLLFFIVYIVFMIYYCKKDIYPLKVEISKILFVNMNEKPEYSIKFGIKNFEKTDFKEKKNLTTQKISIKKKAKNPPKKLNPIRIGGNNNNIKTTKEKKSDITLISKSSRRDLKTNTINIIDNKKEKNSLFRKGTINANNKIDNIDSNELFSNEIKKDDNNNKNDYNYDNFELNNLEYDEAYELDKRGFCRTYWSVLLREHIFLFTFFSCKDYNLFYIKIERFFTLICIEMTMNGLFFVHESMHRKYINNEEFTFVQKIPQLLFTLIFSHIIEVILCFFGMTDSVIYKIKELSKTEKSSEKIIDIITCMRKKLIGFFIFTFILFLFNWYFISAFCAVYQNTQKIFLRDTAVSYLTAMIDPFIIYGLTTFLRYFSLIRCFNKKFGCIYKISELIPIF